jgi:autotransporter-associated beta strand protein
MGAANKLPAGTTVSLNGSTLDLNGKSQSIAGITSLTPASDLVTSSGACILTLAPTADTTYAGLFNGPISLTKNGTAKFILSGANAYNGLTTVASGTLELAPAAQNAVFNLGGADVQGGKLVFDYNGVISPAATIQDLLSDSCDGGLWDTGKFRNSTAGASGLTLGWFDNGSSTVTVMATYAGDFNLDGVVDNADRDIWTANFGMGATWQMGDVNYDGAVNGLDYDQWTANVGKAPIVIGGDSVSGSNVAGVPEPGTLAMLAAGLCGLLAYAQRKK